MHLDPKAAGMCAERLERITSHLESRYIEPGKIAGCQALVARHGHVAYFRSFGQMDRERGREMRDDTIFRIYSMTKPITSVALMQLYERGHFQLGDPVSRFIPEWKTLEFALPQSDPEQPRTQACSPPMSMRDVLMHMSGLPGLQARAPGEAPARPRPRTLRDMVEALADRPLQFQPGTHWNYGISTDVCGYLVEVLSGQRFDHYLEEHMFRPLGMVDTAFSVPADKQERFAANYGRRRDKTLALVDDPEKSGYLRHPTYFSGAGGLVSTSADYLRFCQMLVNRGELDGERILSRRTLALMTRNHLPGGGDLASVATGGYGETAFEGVGFGLGFAVSLGEVATQSVGSEGDYYWGGAASTIFWIDPTEDLCVIFMTQLMPSATFNFRGQLKNLVCGAIVD